MVDRRRIVEQWQQGSSRVLVTLVRAEGSSYRRPGAHLLIGSDGLYSGTISGGCLEAEVVRKAIWKVRNGAIVDRYSTMFDDTAEIPYGLGCGGIVDLLLEPTETPEAHALLAAMEASLAGESRTVITRLPAEGQPLARTVQAPNGDLLFATPGFASNLASLHLADNTVFIERLAPPQRLFVLGAGDDARPLVTLAALLGWSVVVADGRPHLTRPERFPQAEHLVTTNSIAELDIQPNDAIVIMTHSYEQDRTLLAGLLSLPEAPIYLGLLGARHRSSLLVSEAAILAHRTVAECCERLYAPVGLDLGGDGPEAIALAVIAEVQACIQGKLGTSRRLSAEDVAVQIDRGGASRYLQVQCAVGAA